MLTETVETSTIDVTQEPRKHKEEKYLFHPIVDFLCLGGGSLLLFVLLAIFIPLEAATPAASVITLGLANLINHPHFAHSYQIFYQNFWQKIGKSNPSKSLRVRYIVAGLLVPTAVAGFFSTSIGMNDARMLSYGTNIMLFFVGWHYVKQGYGMLIVDSVLKRKFFIDSEKKILVVNAYTCWIFFWLLTNWTISEQNIWGLKSSAFSIPIWILYSGGMVAMVTTVLTLSMLRKKRFIERSPLPLNGLIAYFTSVYIWMALRLDPFFLFLVPLFHSLQYLVVVWRYQYNKTRFSPLNNPPQETDKHDSSSTTLWRFVRFVAVGVALGYLGFWAIPQFLDSTISYNQTVFGGTMFMFIFWIFINIHHYFIDNVIWRRENPDTRRFLFGSS